MDDGSAFGLQNNAIPAAGVILPLSFAEKEDNSIN